MKKSTILNLAFFVALILLPAVLFNCGDNDPTPDDTPENKTDLTVFVKSNTGVDINSQIPFLVLGKDGDGMRWLDYKSDKLDIWQKQKPMLKEAAKYEELKLDTIYMTKDVESGRGAFVLDNFVEPGTYTMHVVDGSLNAHVTVINYTNDEDKTMEIRTKPLGRLEVRTQSSSIAGSTINGVEVALWGTGGDTTNLALKESRAQVSLTAFFSGTTETTTVKGVEQDGYLYFHHIPVREYFAVGYHPTWSKNKIPGEYVSSMKKNATYSILLNFGN
ncbi:MAG: hypothetical protein KDC92_08970 [Bacteroidetes bacterium]|nr:hypothetical protein [Bacteroidota bacterium]